MAKVTFTPWKEHSQLLAVRSQFYPSPSYAGPDLRSKACATVGSWKLRGNLPHPVEATALLTDAILHDDAQKNSIFSIRATYSAAFCRFVTGLVDSKLGGQRMTMFQRAIHLGLPASFVELRHEATHRELPSLIVLRNATQRSLEWLWDYYWVKTDTHAIFAPEPGVSSGVEDDDVEPLKAAARATLEQLTNEIESSEPPRKKWKFQQHLSSTVTQLVSLCKASRRGPCVLSKIFVEDSVLVSRGRKLGDSLADVFTKWDQTLQMITEGYPAFPAALVEELVNELAYESRLDSKNDPHCEGIYMWLDHILGSTQWRHKRQLFSLAYVSTVCEENSNHWTDLLKNTIRTEGNDLSGVPDGQDTATGKPERDIAESDRPAVTEDLKELKKFGWETLDTWDSRPLGIV